jgi:hypothetical protein
MQIVLLYFFAIFCAIGAWFAISGYAIRDRILQRDGRPLPPL